MRHYEIVVMMRSGESDRNKITAERYLKIITDKGGKVHRFEDWGNRVLAYPIERQTRGHYFLFNVECGQEALDELKENFRFSEVIVRSIIVRRENAVSEMSPIAKEAAREAEGDEKVEGGKDEGERGKEQRTNNAAAKSDNTAADNDAEGKQ